MAAFAMRGVAGVLRSQELALERSFGSSGDHVGANALPASSLLAGSMTVQPQGVNNHATEWFWLMGTLLSLLGATMTTVGLLMQKKSHDETEPSLAPAEASAASGSCEQALKQSEAASALSIQGAYWLRSKWLLGGLVWLVGNVICWLGMGMAPQSIVAVFDCWNIIVTLALAPVWFGEKLTMRSVLGQVVVVVGCVWVICFGPKDYHAQTADLLRTACMNPAFLGAACCSACLLGVMGSYAYMNRHGHPAPLTALQYTVVSANFAWYAAILSKCTAALIVTTVTTSVFEVGNNLFLGFVLVFAYCAVGQVHFLNMGMKYGDAVVVIPVYMAMSMTGQMVVGGVIFFQEFAGLGLAAHAKFWPGVICVLAGVVMVSTEERVSKTEQLSSKSKSAAMVNERTPLSAGKEAGAYY